MATNERTTSEIDREIARLQEKREVLAKAEEAFKKMPLREQVAITLHSNLCFSDHTEACGWHYEIKANVHDWKGSTHSHWLKRADKTLANIKLVDRCGLMQNADDTLAVIEAVTARGY